jgi:hypothetical protein
MGVVGTQSVAGFVLKSRLWVAVVTGAVCVFSHGLMLVYEPNAGMYGVCGFFRLVFTASLLVSLLVAHTCLVTRWRPVKLHCRPLNVASHCECLLCNLT